MKNDNPGERVAAELRAFLRRDHVRNVRIAEGATAPPQLAYLVSFPRLSLTLAGDDEMELEENGRIATRKIPRGCAVFVPANCWNRPTWSSRAKVLTLLFGKRQTGVSLVTQRQKTGAPSQAIKAHVHLPLEASAPGVLDALVNLAGKPPRGPVGKLLVEAMLYCCLSLLENQAQRVGGKSERTFHNICLYLQENFQFPLSRESVADHFRLSPNHVSRLFRSEGLMKFNDYLTWVRIDRAKYLLRHHNLTLDEVARSCGFNDTGYFCRVFKRKTKLTPTSYRLGTGDPDPAKPS